MNNASPKATALSAATGNDVWSATSALLRQRTQWPPVTPGPRPAELPLAFAQERLWSLVQLDPRSPLYNIPLAWRLTGVVDGAVLERALQTVCQRHESLRLTFHEREGRPFARLASETPLKLRVVDLRSLPLAAREVEALRQAEAEARAPFDLAAQPQVRASLFRLEEAQHWLLVTVHQIIFDGWSIRVLCREIGAALRGTASPAPPLQAVDFAQWQRTWLTDETLEPALVFWRRLLAEPCSPCVLPWDREHIRDDTGPAGRAAFHLPRAQLEALRAVARAADATPFMLLHATWTALLHRLSGPEDVLIFASLANRTQPALQPVIGLLANVLPLRTRLPANPGFREVLRASRAVVAGGLANQLAPFERIIESLRSAGGGSLFQMLLIYQNAPAPPPAAGGVRFDWLSEVDNGAAKFDLLLDVAHSPEGVRGTLKFRADRFDATTIEALLADWGALVEQILATPEQPLAQLALPRLGQREIKASAPAPVEIGDGSLGEAYRDGLELKLTAIWQEVLGISHVNPLDSFFDLGGHSMRAVRLFTEIEDQLNRRLPIATLFRAPTLAQLASVLREDGCDAQWPALVPIQPHGTQPPFIWLHTLGGGGGGGLLRYRALANLLGPEQPSFGIEAPHEPFTDIKVMAAAYLEMLKTLQPRGPYFLGGYCFAANVAFEMACQLEARGEQVAMLALLEAMPPEAMHRRTPLTARNFGAFAANLAFWARDFVCRSPRVIGSDLWRILGRLRSRKDATANFHELGEVLDLSEYPAGFRQYAEVHYRAMQQYRPGVYRGPITLFRARTRALFKFDPQLGWGPHAAGGITVRIVPGKHEEFLEEPLVRVLAEQFRQALATARGTAATHPLAAARHGPPPGPAQLAEGGRESAESKRGGL